MHPMAPGTNQAHARETLKHSHHHRAQSSAQASPSGEAGIATLTAPQKDEQIIREYAYHLFEQRHCEHGHDVEDWMEAVFSLTPSGEVRDVENQQSNVRRG